MLGGMHPSCCKMSLVSGPDKRQEAAYSRVHSSCRFTTPSPPQRIGRAIIFLMQWLMSNLSDMDGRKWSQMAVSSGVNSSPLVGVVLEMNFDLWHSP